MSTRLEWAVAIQKGLGDDPYNEGNVALVNLFVAEGSKAENNPDDTIEPEPGATAFNTFDNSLHVWNYPSMQEGVTAVISTLHNGLNDEVLAALHAQQDAEHVTAAIATKSSWDSAGTLYLRTLSSTRADFATLAGAEVPGPNPEVVPVSDPTPAPEPAPVDDTPPQEAAVESAVAAQTEAVKVDTDEGKVGAARAKLAELKVHFLELEDLLK
jgi:hypothetical protein